MNGQFRIVGRMTLAFLLFGLVSEAGAMDAFEAQQKAEAAQNLPGVTCTLQLPHGKTVFHQGELIPLEVQFTSDRPNLYQLDPYIQPRPGGLEFCAFRVSPSGRAPDPLADLPAPSGVRWIGLVPPPLPLSSKPVTVPVELNDWVRFDAPGRYRVYAVSHRILPAAPPGSAESNPFLPGKRAAKVAVSNIIQLTILPQDDVWSHAKLEMAVAELKAPNGPYLDEHEPAPEHILRNLGTHEAAQAMLARLATDVRPRSSPVESEQYYTGLIGFKDRRWLVEEMKRELVRPDYTVTQPFLQDLALISALEEVPSTPATTAQDAAASRAGKLGEREKRVSLSEQLFLLQDWHLAADSVSLKTGRARAMSLHTLLELAWIDAAIVDDAAVQGLVPGLTVALVAGFDDLPPVPQESLLGEMWRWIRRPQMLPALRVAWARLQPASVYNSPRTADLVLRRIYDLSPAEGEKIILQRIASPHPKVSPAALKILPARTLPALDTILAAKLKDPLNTNQETLNSNDLTTELIQRYASGAILPAVKAYNDKGGPFRNIVALLAYFLRVDPAYGKAMLQQQLAKPGGGTYDFWTDLARRYFDPQVESLAIEHLNNPDPEAVTSAARMLEQYGSPAAEGPLMARLARRDDDPASREKMEWVLVEALDLGKGWLVDGAQTRTIRALCTTHDGQFTADRYVGGIPGKVRLEYSEGDPDRWDVGQYYGWSLASLKAKIAEYPRGTVFQWQLMESAPNEPSLFKQIQAFVEAHGMRMERFKVLGAGA